MARQTSVPILKPCQLCVIGPFAHTLADVGLYQFFLSFDNLMG